METRIYFCFIKYANIGEDNKLLKMFQNIFQFLYFLDFSTPSNDDSLNKTRITSIHLSSVVMIDTVKHRKRTIISNTITKKQAKAAVGWSYLAKNRQKMNKTIS